ncbi:MAG: ceramidase domain-containing protein [Hyphomicrobiaceae bacterium]
MSWNTQIFAYCERGRNGEFWAEPLNAATNAAFLVAAVMAFASWRGRPRQQRDAFEPVLIGLAIAVGCGSFLFHTFATHWAAAADILPIGVFMVTYLVCALRRFVGLPAAGAVIAAALFVLLMYVAASVRCGDGPCLNGSLPYVPALMALIGIGAERWLRGHPAGRPLFVAGLVFLLSLTLRTIDRTLCPWTLVAGTRVIGLHFVWHVLNALVLYLLLRTAFGDRLPVASDRQPK